METRSERKRKKREYLAHLVQWEYVGIFVLEFWDMHHKSMEKLFISFLLTA